MFFRARRMWVSPRSALLILFLFFAILLSMNPKIRITIPQYRLISILSVWASAALPMAFLAWVAVPKLADTLSGPDAFTKSLLICLTVGLIWQFVLIMLLVKREQGDLQWATIKQALWLQKPTSPKTKKIGGKIWWVLVPMIIFTVAEEFIPNLPHPDIRDLGILIESEAGKQFFSHAWGWYGLTLTLLVFNTILGEELLFRGFLLPRMRKVFGKKDWLANGALFAFYHLHTPWVIPGALLDSFILSYPARYYKSTLLSIIVHSIQSILIAIVVLTLVLT